MRPKCLLSWSSGKDAAWALHVLRQRREFDIAGLLTVVSHGDDRVAMHAVRERLLESQAEAAGVALWKAEIPNPCSSEQYGAAMSRVVERARAAGVTHFAFGDLFLEDVRASRERNLAATGMKPIFPIWGQDPRALANDMVDAGLRAILVSVDPTRLDARFCGRVFDESFLRDLPPEVDACGERGEFHTFAFAGPMFSHQIRFTVGETELRDGYVYTDIVDANARRAPDSAGKSPTR